MAIHFNSSTDGKLKVNAYSAINSLSALTISVWTYRYAAGGNNLGRIVDKLQSYLGGAAGTNGFAMYYDNTNSRHIFDYSLWNNTHGEWYWPFSTANTLYHTYLTYDASSTTNDPLVWVNGSSQTITETSTPVGTLGTETRALTIGNRDDNIRNWGGAITHVAIWNRVLSSNEGAAIRNRFDPRFFPSGLVGYWPMSGRYLNNEINLANGQGTSLAVASGTVDLTQGDTVTPRLIYLAGRQHNQAVSAPGESLLVGSNLIGSRLLYRPSLIGA